MHVTKAQSNTGFSYPQIASSAASRFPFPFPFHDQRPPLFVPATWAKYLMQDATTALAIADLFIRARIVFYSVRRGSFVVLY